MRELVLSRETTSLVKLENPVASMTLGSTVDAENQMVFGFA